MMDRYVTVGLGVLAGAVLFEAALIPAIVIGGSVVLAARYLAAPRSRRLPDTEKVGQAQRRPGAELAPRQNDEPRILEQDSKRLNKERIPISGVL